MVPENFVHRHSCSAAAKRSIQITLESQLDSPLKADRRLARLKGVHLTETRYLQFAKSIDGPAFQHGSRLSPAQG